MSQLKGAINQKNRQLTTARISIISLTLVCIGLLFVIWSFPNRLQVHIPPDLKAGSQRLWWEVPKPNVYAFAYQVFQQLHRWTRDGLEDYEKNIETLRPLLTPGCYHFLTKDYEDRRRNSELRHRTRGVYEIVGRGFSADRVTVLSRDSWVVNLDLSVDEYFQDEPVKRTFTRFPVSIIRMEVDMQANPWGLGFNCYPQNAIPLRLESIESDQNTQKE